MPMKKNPINRALAEQLNQRYGDLQTETEKHLVAAIKACRKQRKNGKWVYMLPATYDTTMEGNQFIVNRLEVEEESVMVCGHDEFGYSQCAEFNSAYSPEWMNLATEALSYMPDAKKVRDGKPLQKI